MRFLYLVVFFVPIIGVGQVGGNSGYQALTMTSNSRSAALSGSTISIEDGDISQFFENPATLDSVTAKSFYFNINPYFVDISVLTGAYSFSLNKLGTFSVGLNYIDYGTFESTDDAGNTIGSVNAQDYVVSLGKSHRLGPIILGVNLKMVHSGLDSYTSTAVVGDIGGIFNVNKNWNVGMTFANVGSGVTDYTISESLPVPFSVKIGTTFKPEYMPFRFTLTSGNLAEENVVEANAEEGRSNEALEKVLRRVNLGVELLLSDNFQFLVGYNHKRKQELRLDERGGGAGFSYGLMVGIKQFKLRFSRATYHAAGGTSFISIQTNFNDFRKIL